MRYFVLIVEFCEPRLEGPFATAENRDGRAREIHNSGELNEDGLVVWLDLGRGGPDVGAYSGAFFEEGDD